MGLHVASIDGKRTQRTIRYYEFPNGGEVREGVILGVCYTPNLKNVRLDRNESKSQHGALRRSRWHSGDSIGIRNL